MWKKIALAAGLCLMFPTYLIANPLAPHWGLVDSDGPPRTHHQIAYFPDERSVIMFGGMDPRGQLTADLWEWYEGQWQEVNLSAGPSGRMDFGMVYDTLHHNIVLFGGQDLSGQCFGDTWLLTDSGWVSLIIQGPSPRAQFAMAYDMMRNKVVLFGGTDNQLFYGDTWEFDGTSWALREDVTGPTPRMYSAMAYDRFMQKCVLFGGLQGGDVMPLLQDTWLYDGNWSELPAAGPPARMGHVLGYDSFFQKILLYGGEDTTQSYEYFDDTWWLFHYSEEWGDIDLRIPSRRAFASIAFHDSLDPMVLFGGNNGSQIFGETWLWPVFNQEDVYIPGDVNGNGAANGLDIVFLVNYFKGGAVPPRELHDSCPNTPDPFYAAADVNGNCIVNGIDITYYVRVMRYQEPRLLYCPSCPP